MFWARPPAPEQAVLMPHRPDRYAVRGKPTKVIEVGHIRMTRPAEAPQKGIRKNGPMSQASGAGDGLAPILP